MPEFRIGNKTISQESPCYIIAEISCNHEGDINEAKAIIKAAYDAGADAVKLQTYTAETITRDFKTKPVGTMWEETDLHNIYKKAYTPWEWFGELKETAAAYNLDIFSSPFDETAVDFLIKHDVPIFKVASFEIVDTKLLEKIAKTEKPVIISTGMTDFLEIKEAINTLETHGTSEIALLHCNSGYPASFKECNLKTINALQNLFPYVVGLSDHTIFYDDQNFTTPLPHIAPIEAVKLGAKILEVHLTTDREKGRTLHSKDQGGYDWAFSRNPDELKKLITDIRTFEKTQILNYPSEIERQAAQDVIGTVRFEPTEKEIASRKIRPSLWVIEDIKAGEILTFAGGKTGNIDSIRPSGGIHIRYADYINGLKANKDIPAGTPLSWKLIDC